MHAIPIGTDDIEAIMALLRQDDKDFIIDSPNYSETFKLNSGTDTPYTSARTVVNKISETGAEKLILIEFSVTINLQSYRANKFRRIEYSYQQNDQDLYTLVVSGIVTGDGATTAFDMFTAGIEAVENLGKALIGDNDDGNLSNTLLDSPVTDIVLDRENGELSFTRTFAQLPDPANTLVGGVETRDDTIVFPLWDITRADPLRKGINLPHLTTFNVAWTARFKQSKGQGASIQQYETQVQALLIKRLKDIFSESDTLILEVNEIRYSGTGKAANGNWVVTSKDTTVSYSENIQTNIVFADSDPVADGKDMTEAPHSTGARLTLIQIVNHIRRGTPPGTPPAPLVTFNGVAMRMFLKTIDTDEGNELVGKVVGEGANVTGQTTEYSLDWRSTYKAFSLPTDPDFKKSVTGGDEVNIQGKVIEPV